LARAVDAAEQQEGCEEEACAGGRRQCRGGAAFFTRGPFGASDERGGRRAMTRGREYGIPKQREPGPRSPEGACLNEAWRICPRCRVRLRQSYGGSRKAPS